MVFAITSAILSAVCMALMIVTDRIMVSDCYRSSANQAWFVSSVAGGILGLVFTSVVWAIAVVLGMAESMSSLFSAAIASFLWRGAAMCVLGALAIQTLLHYFRLQASQMHSAAIAVWLAAIPVFVYLGMLAVTLLFPVELVTGTTLNPYWVTGVVIATLGLVGFERATASSFSVARIHRKELGMLMLVTVLFMIMMRQLTGGEGIDVHSADGLLLLPYYWIGFLAGGRVLMDRKQRSELIVNIRRRVRFFVVPILLTEIIGMLVFAFEYFALNELDPALVSLIVGIHVLLVYAMNHGLGNLRRKLKHLGIRRLNWGGIRITVSKLPSPSTDRKQFAIEVATMSIAIGGLLMALYMTPTAFF